MRRPKLIRGRCTDESRCCHVSELVRAEQVNTESEYEP
jgi:hypothetical protein